MADLNAVLLSILIGTLAAIVYTLRMVVLMDRKLTLLCQRQGISARQIAELEGEEPLQKKR